MLNRFKGYSLLELLVAMGLSLVILTAIVSTVAHGLATQTENYQRTYLRQSLVGLVHAMSTELRRAGYGGEGFNTVAIAPGYSRQSPPDPANGRLLILTSCVLFAYDRNGNSALESNENDGFRWNGVDALERRRRTQDCGQNRWEQLSDAKTLVIDHLTFTLTVVPHPHSQWSLHQIEIGLSASLRHRPDMKLSLRQSVFTPNHPGVVL